MLCAYTLVLHVRRRSGVRVRTLGTATRSWCGFFGCQPLPPPSAAEALPPSPHAACATDWAATHAARRLHALEFDSLVKFATGAEAREAMATLNGSELDGRTLQVREVRPVWRWPVSVALQVLTPSAQLPLVHTARRTGPHPRAPALRSTKAPGATTTGEAGSPLASRSLSAM